MITWKIHKIHLDFIINAHKFQKTSNIIDVNIVS